MLYADEYNKAMTGIINNKLNKNLLLLQQISYKPTDAKSMN